MAERTVTIRLTVSDNFSNTYNRYNQATRQAEQNNRRLGDSTKQASQGFLTLENAVKVAGVAFAGMRLAEAVGELRAVGKEAQTARATFNQLSGGIESAARTMQMMRKATKGIVDDTTLMQGANRLLLMGLAQTGDEVARLTRIAVQLGAAMGQDAAKSIEDFGLLLSNQSIMRLDNFGISSGRVRERMKELAAEFPEMTKEMRFMTATLEEGETALDKLGDSTDVAAGAFERLQTKIANAQSDLAEFVATGIESGAQLAQIVGSGQGGADPTLNALLQAATFGQYQFFADEGVQGLQHIFQRELREIMTRNFFTDLKGIGGRLSGIGQSLISGFGERVNQPNITQAFMREQLRQSTFGQLTQGRLDLFNIAPFTSQQGGLFTEAQAQEAERLAADAERIAESIKDAKDSWFLTDEERTNAQAMADTTAEMAEHVRKGADQWERIRDNLDAVLGRGAGGLGGQIADVIAQDLATLGASEELIAGFKSQTDIAFGRETETGEFFEKTLSDTIAMIGTEIGLDEMVAATERLTEVMRSPEFTAAADDPIRQQQIAQRAVGFRMTPGRVGQEFTVRPGDTPGAFAQALGIPLEELLAITSSPSTRAFRTGTFNLPGGRGIEPIPDPFRRSGPFVPDISRSLDNQAMLMGDVETEASELKGELGALDGTMGDVRKRVTGVEGEFGPLAGALDRNIERAGDLTDNFTRLSESGLAKAKEEAELLFLALVDVRQGLRGILEVAGGFTGRNLTPVTQPTAGRRDLATAIGVTVRENGGIVPGDLTQGFRP